MATWQTRFEKVPCSELWIPHELNLVSYRLGQSWLALLPRFSSVSLDNVIYKPTTLAYVQNRYILFINSVN